MPLAAYRAATAFTKLFHQSTQTVEDITLPFMRKMTTSMWGVDSVAHVANGIVSDVAHADTLNFSCIHDGTAHQSTRSPSRGLAESNACPPRQVTEELGGWRQRQ